MVIVFVFVLSAVGQQQAMNVYNITHRNGRLKQPNIVQKNTCKNSQHPLS